MKEINLDYFNGLGIKEILELARKSIQLTAENREIDTKLWKIKTLLTDYRFEAQEKMKDGIDKNLVIEAINEMLEILEVKDNE